MMIDIIHNIQEKGGHAFPLPNGGLVTDMPALAGWMLGTMGKGLPEIRTPDLAPCDVSCPDCKKEGVCEEKGAAIDYHPARWKKAYNMPLCEDCGEFIRDAGFEGEYCSKRCAHSFMFNGEQLWFQEDVYFEGRRLRLDIIDKHGACYAVLTKNDPEQELLDGEFIVKTCDENEHIARRLLEIKMFVDTGKRVPAGYNEHGVWRWFKTRLWESTSTCVQYRTDVTPFVYLHTNIGWVPIGNTPEGVEEAEKFAIKCAAGYDLIESSPERARSML